MRTVTLGDYIEILSGFAFKSSLFNSEARGLPLVRIRDVVPGYSETYSDEDFDEKYLLEDGDLLIGMDGEFNCARWKGGKALLNQRVCRVIASSKNLDDQYLFYFLPRPLKQIEAKSNFVTVKHLSVKQIQAIKIPLPPLEEQRRIAAILDKADGVRRKRKEAIRLTEELLKSTFLEMFGDPVTNPKGWEICSMKKIVVETQYGTAEKSQEVMGGLPILRMNNITYSGEIDLNSLKWCQIPPKDEDKFTVKRGDLLFNRTNSPELVGKTAVWRSDGKFAYAGYLIRVRFDKSKANSEYVSAFLNSNYGKRYLLEKAKPSINMSNFSASEFLKIPILLPDIETQHRFDEFVSYTRMMSQHLSDGLGDYNNLFNSLLQRAFRGEL